MVKQIPLTQGKFALIDDEDFDYLNQWKWQNAGRYATRRVKNGKKRSAIWMHRIINKTPEDMITDHIDGNGLNNCKSNLRSCTFRGNAKNANTVANNSTGFKGVKQNRHYNRWSARISVRPNSFHLGYYNSPQEAAKAYDEAALKYHGEFALTNKMMGLLK